MIKICKQGVKLLTFDASELNYHFTMIYKKKGTYVTYYTDYILKYRY